MAVESAVCRLVYASVQLVPLFAPEADDRT
jgi:hypothetical protein